MGAAGSRARVGIPWSDSLPGRGCVMTENQTTTALEFRIRRSILSNGRVQIVRLGSGMDAGGFVGEISDIECDAEAVADRIVALWNAALKEAGNG